MESKSVVSDLEKFQDVVCKILMIELSQLNDDLKRNEVKEWDSMTHLMLITELEETFGVAFDDDDVAEIGSIGDLKEVLRKHGVLLS